jgi:hypothetical protein
MTDSDIACEVQPATLLQDLSRVAEVLGDERLAAAVALVSGRSAATEA